MLGVEGCPFLSRLSLGEQWELIADLFRDNAKLGGRTRTVSIYAVMNAILACPVSGMHMAGVTGRFSQLVNSLWLFSSMAKRWYMSLQVHDLLYQWVRVAAGRDKSPTDTQQLVCQSVETATMISQAVGYDAGKHIHGRKRQLKCRFTVSRF